MFNFYTERQRNNSTRDNLIFIVLCLGAILLVVILRLASTPDTTNITAFGDSITEGLYSRSGGYPPKLTELLSSNGTPAVVVNTGISGEKTPQGATRFNKVLSEFPASIVLIMEGTHDVLRGLSVETTQQNLQAMIDIAKTRGVIPILGTLPPNNQSAMATLIPHMWNPMIISLAKTNGIKLADHYSAILPTWTSSTVDGLHPNDTGHLTIANTWYLAIREMISSREKPSLMSIIGYQAMSSEIPDLPQLAAPLYNYQNSIKEFRDALLLASPPAQQIVRAYNRSLSQVMNYLDHHEESRPVVITMFYIVKTLFFPLLALSYLIFLLGLPLQLPLLSAIMISLIASSLFAKIYRLREQPI